MSQQEAGRPWGEADLAAQLLEEFGSLLDPAVLRTIAQEEFESFDSARIRDFVPLLAYRRARARVIRHLRSEMVIQGAASREADLRLL